MVTSLLEYGRIETTEAKAKELRRFADATIWWGVSVQPLVAKGDTVVRGQTIGLVGQSGRVTGPHTHWSARYGSITVNPDDLTRIDPAWYSGTAGKPRARPAR